MLKEMSDVKWAILAFCVASCFGVEYSTDNPAILKEFLSTHFSGKYDPTQFEIYYSLFYSCSAIPNTVFPFIMGYLIDRMGVRKLYSLLAVLSVIGQALVSVGIHQISLGIVYPGRMILGMACESMAIVQGVFLSQYFGKNQMSFVAGAIYSLANLGGVINSYYAPSIAIKFGITAPFWLGTVSCAVVGVLAVFGCILDKKVEVQIAKERREHSSEIEEQPFINERPQVQLDELGEEIAEAPSMLDIKSFPKAFWYICFGAVLIQVSIQAFDVIGASYLTSKWFAMESIDAATQDSGVVLSMFKISSFIFSPIVGCVVDKTKETSLFFMMGCIMALIAHTLVIITRPLVPCMLLGMASTLVYTACWPFIMHIIEKKHVGKAVGLLTSLENIGLVVIPVLDGWLKNTFGSYDDSQMFLAFLAFIGTVLAVILYIKDENKGRWSSWRIQKTKKI